MQTWALLIDTWRLLRARRLFWISLALSAFFGLLVLSVDFTSDGWRIGFGLVSFVSEDVRVGTPAAEGALLSVYGAVVRWWLTFFGLILGLISTASIFPDLLAPGAIDWLASKPISRWRLFVTKFVSALLFVAAQTVLVVLFAWLAFRWRLGFWHHAVWWTLPLVVLLFSYLYAISVYIGVKTRSVLSALLLTLLFWAALASAQLGERILGQLSRTSATANLGSVLHFRNEEATRANAERLRQGSVALMLALPKTAETTDLIRRLTERDDASFDYGRDRWGAKLFGITHPNDLAEVEATGRQDREALRGLEKSPLWIIGTSLMFEVVVLAFALRRFRQRDF
jgi:ABC-type transport system involved in multi-copper enzyme maturation permease subunit